MPKHASSEPQKLLLIKASAGSGKTHRLTGEYLRLLFSAENRYKHILAVTFTNKATDEMKSRILKELNTLSSGGKSDYLEKLKSEFTLSEKQIREKARYILETILHDYSSFSISTIDRFFQQTMRAFTREMGLAGGYRLELDESFMLDQIIDLMIFELDKPQNKELAGWILEFMKHQIEEGKGWKIKESIGQLAHQLFNEKYKLLPNEDKIKIKDKKQLNEYRQIMLKIIREWENRAKSIGKRALAIMESFGLNYSDFKNGRNSGFLTFVKLANGEFEEPSARFFSRVDNLEDWYIAKSAKKEQITAAYFEGLNACVKEAVELFQNNLHYNSALSILQNFYTLGILDDIRVRLTQYQQENNTLFLSDTTELLNKIIADSDSPFIYEKTGSRIGNYMIDEFQDTSSMQWQNFRPLLDESLSRGEFNLIVGDVKQSIYRWRNSDWGLLENQIPNDFGENIIQHEVLASNWRSDARVVQFNNSVFKTAAEILQTDFDRSAESEDQTKIKDAYRHVSQLIPSKKNVNEGYVKLSFIDTSDKENTWEAQSLQQLPLEIERLQDQGFALRDIAILVRKNTEAVEVAETLLKYREEHPNTGYRYDIVSNEALIIGNAQSVKAAIALFRHFQNPKDNNRRMLAVYEYYRFHKHLLPETAISNYFDNDRQDFPDEIKPELNRISTLPFYEMAEEFFAISENALNEKENAYVQAFLDIVLKFSMEASSNLNDFLDWWEQKGRKKTLFSSDDQDAIRLITIHKAKGLGFGAVLLPFLKWNIDHTPSMGPILWCTTNIAPFNLLGTLPLQYKTSLENTIFRDDYLKEKLYTYIDNLNLLYVAFTRAKSQIIACAPQPAKEKESVSDISSLLWQTLHAQPTNEAQLSLSEYLYEQENNTIFEFGSSKTGAKKAEEVNSEKVKSSPWHSIPFNNRLKLRLNSEGFFSQDGRRAYGTLMHEIISNIKTIDNLSDSIEEKYISGEINAEEKTEIQALLSVVLSNPEVADWYSGNYEVLNETQVLHPSFGFSRPDRVMIGSDKVLVVDYKFGDLEEEKYKRQVRHYVSQIQNMGYTNVQGFVFYVKTGRVVNV